MVQKVQKKVGFEGSNKPKLTPTEQEVLYYLTNDFLTPKQIALRREKSIESIYKIIRNLRKKGAINRQNKKVHFFECTIVPFKNGVRLHGQEIHINILYKDHRYKEILRKSNIIEKDGNTLRLFNNTIELYINKSFMAQNVDKATWNSINYINRLIRALECDLKVILIKPRYQNIKIVKQHYSEINNEIAKDCERKGEKLRIEAKEDGKIWLHIDNSFNLHELETIHPNTAKQDMAKVKKVFDDIREKENYLPSEIKNTVNVVVSMLHELTAAQINNTKMIESLLPKKEKIEPKDPKIKPDYVG